MSVKKKTKRFSWKNKFSDYRKGVLTMALMFWLSIGFTELLSGKRIDGATVGLVFVLVYIIIIFFIKE
jgi:hypothetical protein